MDFGASLSPADPETFLGVHRLVTDHVLFIDQGQASRIADLYAPDGELIGLPPSDLIGRDAISEWARQREANVARGTRHVQSNLRVYWDGDGTLHADLYVMLFVSKSGDTSRADLASVGQYHDIYVRDEGEWRIRRREIQPFYRAT